MIDLIASKGADRPPAEARSHSKLARQVYYSPAMNRQWMRQRLEDFSDLS